MRQVTDARVNSPKHLLETLARELVLDPERVSVEENEQDGRVRLALRVARADRGRVIGRGGRTVAALRVVLEAVARQRGTGCEMEVLD
jgi:hypothetical protein